MWDRCRWVIVGLTMWGLSCGGCGGDRPQLGEVTGRVTLDGRPLAEARVTFCPAEGTAGRESVGFTDAEGNYTLVYIRDIPGASVGRHTVRVSREVNGAERVPQRYNIRSELNYEVVAGAQEINLELVSN